MKRAAQGKARKVPDTLLMLRIDEHCAYTVDRVLILEQTRLVGSLKLEGLFNATLEQSRVYFAGAKDF